MAQTGFTPIQIYYSTTSSNLPLAANLTNGELAINSADGKLFYKDSGGTVQTLASQNLFASQTANYVYASPNGSAGVPTFRALVATDIPSLSGSYVPYTGASSAVDLNAQTVVNIDHLGVGTTTVPTILVRAVGDNNSNSRIAMRGYSSNANSSSIRVTKFRGSAGTPQAPLSGDSLGKFELAGYGTTSSDGYAQASFEGVATENWGATARGAKTLIKVTPNTTITQVTAVTVDQDSKATFAGALSVTGHTTFEGVTSTGATGTGKLVYDTSPTLITPTLGVATATSINKMAITAPATSSTLAVADGKTFTASKTLTLTGTDSTTMTFPATSATIARTDAAQTFTGLQTFDTVATNGSVTLGNDATDTVTTSGNIILAKATGTATLAPVEVRISSTNSGSDWDFTNPWAKLGFYSNDTGGVGYAHSFEVVRENAAGTDSILYCRRRGGSNSWSVDANGNFSTYGNTTLGDATTDTTTVAGAMTVNGLIKPQQATTAGAPAYVKGAIYFDTTLNKLRVGGATAWETITSV